MTFSIEPVPEYITRSMKEKNIWTAECPISLQNLRLLTLQHYDFEKNLFSGQLIVHEKISSNVIQIFRELFKIKFPIAKIQLMDTYNGDDNISMESNNSSCFNYRKIANSNIISMHSYGLAIDINPVQNPYITEGSSKNNLKIWPDQGKDYLNRNNSRPGMVEPVVGIFAKYGFDVWGGSWNLPVDYHHFQVQRTSLPEFL